MCKSFTILTISESTFSPNLLLSHFKTRTFQISSHEFLQRRRRTHGLIGRRGTRKSTSLFVLFRSRSPCIHKQSVSVPTSSNQHQHLDTFFTPTDDLLISSRPSNDPRSKPYTTLSHRFPSPSPNTELEPKENEQAPDQDKPTTTSSTNTLCQNYIQDKLLGIGSLFSSTSEHSHLRPYHLSTASMSSTQASRLCTNREHLLAGDNYDVGNTPEYCMNSMEHELCMMGEGGVQTSLRVLQEGMSRLLDLLVGLVDTSG